MTKKGLQLQQTVSKKKEKVSLPVTFKNVITKIKYTTKGGL